MALFFYESVLNLLGFFALLYILRKTKKKGVVTLTWFAYYGFIRFFLEQLRETKYIMYIPNTTIQWSSVTSIIMFVIGVGGLIAIFVKDYLDKKNGLVLSSEKVKLKEQTAKPQNDKSVSKTTQTANEEVEKNTEDKS